MFIDFGVKIQIFFVNKSNSCYFGYFGYFSKSVAILATKLLFLYVAILATMANFL